MESCRLEIERGRIHWSDGRYDGFVGLAMSAIIDVQIKARLLWFDAGQYQRPAAFRAGRPKVIDKLELKRVCHGKISQRLCTRKSESILGVKPFHVP
jgi:hypothetical protein